MLTAHPLLKIRACCHQAFTLTEATIVLGAVGLVLGAIWTTLPNVYTNFRANQMAKAVVQLEQVDAQITKADYYKMGVDTALSSTSVDALVAAGAFPAGFIASQDGDVITTGLGYQLKVTHNYQIARTSTPLSVVGPTASVTAIFGMNSVAFEVTIPPNQFMASVQCEQLAKKLIALPRVSGLYISNGSAEGIFGKIFGMNGENLAFAFSRGIFNAQLAQNYGAFSGNIPLTTISRLCTPFAYSSDLTVAISFDRDPGIVP